MLDYGRTQVHLGVHRRRLPQGDRHGARQRDSSSSSRPTCASASRAARARARTTMRDGDIAYVALSWTEHGAPETYDEAYQRLVRTADYWHEWLAHGDFPDHPWRAYLQRSALTLKGLTYAPDRARWSRPRRRRCPRRRAASATGTTATRGSATPRSCSGALYTLGFDWEANDFFYFIADVADGDDDLQIMYGIGGERELDEADARPPRRLRGRHAGADRQRRLQPASSTTSGARCSTRSTCTRSRATSCPRSVWPILCSQVEAAIAQLARARPRDLGGPRRARSTSRRRRSCAGSRATAARGWRGCASDARARRALAGRRRRDPRRRAARTASTSAACSSSTTTPTRSTRRCC